MALDPDITDAVDGIIYADDSSASQGNAINQLIRALSSPDRAVPAELLNDAVEIPALTVENIGEVVFLTRKAAINGGIGVAPEE